jgi:HAD superfamily hydrolase (TIGR01509 family)
MPINAFVIDCDGTLVETEQLWKLAERETIERWGGTWSEAIGVSLAGNSLETSACRIADCVNAPREHESVAEELVSVFRERLHSAPVRARDGARELLAELAARGLPVAVASNGMRVDVEAALESAGLLPAIAEIHCPEGELRPKPHPDLYLAACAGLGAVAANSIAIEDAVPGVQAARSAGLLTLGLASPDGAVLVEAEHMLRALWPLDIDALGLMLKR